MTISDVFIAEYFLRNLIEFGIQFGLNLAEIIRQGVYPACAVTIAGCCVYDRMPSSTPEGTHNR